MFVGEGMADGISSNDKRVLKVVFNPDMPVEEAEECVEQKDDGKPDCLLLLIQQC